MLNTLPYRDELKSSAPNARAPWSTVRWSKASKIRYLYVFHGIGYEGTARIEIDYRGWPPRLKVKSIVPKVEAGLWKEL